MNNASPKATREQRRDAARAQAAQLRADQAARERRTRNILFAVLGGVVIVAVVLGIVIWRVGTANQNRSLLEDFAGAVPANSDIRGGVTVGPTGTAGEVTEGAPTLTVHLDFMCPYCGDFEAANAVELDELRADGDLNVTYRVVANLDRFSNGTAFSTRSANAAATVASVSPEHYVAFIEGMFANQPEENTDGLSDAQIAQIAVEAGVPQEVADTFATGIYNEWVGVATQQSSREGVRGTPSAFLDGVQVPNTVNFYQPGVLATWLAEQGIGGEDPLGSR